MHSRKNPVNALWVIYQFLLFVISPLWYTVAGHGIQRGELSRLPERVHKQGVLDAAHPNKAMRM